MNNMLFKRYFVPLHNNVRSFKSDLTWHNMRSVPRQYRHVSKASIIGLVNLATMEKYVRYFRGQITGGIYICEICGFPLYICLQFVNQLNARFPFLQGSQHVTSILWSCVQLHYTHWCCLSTNQLSSKTDAHTIYNHKCRTRENDV
jgi:hypothetical protein